MTMDESADEIEKRASRRRLLREMAGVAVALPFAPWKALPVWAQGPARVADRPRDGDP